MTVTHKSNGDLVVRKKDAEKLRIKAGDRYVVRRGAKSGVVLRRSKSSRKSAARRRAYLTPPVLSRSTLKRIYSTPDPIWDKVEAEAVSLSQKDLAGFSLEDL